MEILLLCDSFSVKIATFEWSKVSKNGENPPLWVKPNYTRLNQIQCCFKIKSYYSLLYLQQDVKLGVLMIRDNAFID